MHKVPLAPAIQELRQQLNAAEKAGQTEQMKFRVKQVELDLSLGVTSSGDRDININFWILSLDAAGKFEENTIQKIKLILEPIGPDGRTKEIGDID